MKAIRVEKNGDPSVLQLQDIPTPTPKMGEALVRMKAAGLNYTDIYSREGRYKSPLPYTPGREGAGIVESVGDGVTDVKPGDRVAYGTGPSSYAEYSVVPAAQLIPLPEAMSFEDGAAFPLQGMTAHYLLHDLYPLKRGETLLVHAAAGGVGLLLVQWAKQMGVRVIGTVSTEQKAKVAKEAGADHVILYTKQDFAEETKNITGGKGAEYIIDGVAKTTFAKDLEAVAVRGQICIYGAASGPADPISPNALMPKALTLSSGSLMNFVRTRDELLKRAHDVLQGIREGWLKLRIDRVLPLAEAAEAHRLMEGRKTMGKVILRVG